MRGTLWLTEDRCDGTLTRVSEGAVASATATAAEAARAAPGERYLARSPALTPIACALLLAGLLAVCAGSAATSSGASTRSSSTASTCASRCADDAAATTSSSSPSTTSPSPTSTCSGRSRARCYARPPTACTRPARARSSSTSSSPRRPSRARTSRSTTPSAAPAAPCSPRARATATGGPTSSAARRTCARSARVAGAANLPDEDEGVVRRFRHSDGGLRRSRVAVAERAGKRVAAGDFERRGTLDRLPRRPGDGPRPSRSPTSTTAGSTPSVFKDKIVVVGASAPTLQDVHPTSTAGDEPHVRPGDPGQRDLDRAARPAAARRARLASTCWRSCCSASPSRSPRCVRAALAALGALALGFAYAVAAQLAFEPG